MKNYNYKKIFFIVGPILFFIILAALFFLFKPKNEQIAPENKPNVIKNNYLCEKISALNGFCLGEKELEYPNIAAVMIENHSDARPQAGINHADLVFEAEAEGQITRFLAIYDLNRLEQIDKIGPVRSARNYYLEWAMEFNPVYVHVGGSPQALENIKKYGIADFDQFFLDQYFWRSSDRYAPHNVYTSLEMLKSGAKEKNINLEKNNNFQAWKFKKDLEESFRTLEVKNILIDYSLGINSKIEWRYDKNVNKYLRFQADKKHVDEAGEQISTNNLVIMYTDYSVIDDKGRLDMKTIGTGKAIIFLDGKIILGTWKKDSLNSRTKFFDNIDKEIEFNQGKTWIEVVNDNIEVTY